MSANVEIKARVADPADFAARARSLCGADPVVIEQADVFFRAACGRLKLRRFDGSRGELIHYERPDAVGPKTSRYRLVPTDDPDGLTAALTDALGEIGRVVKTRRLWLAGRTRIHLDAVAGLGDFMELEVVLGADEDPATGEAEARALMARLGVAPGDLVEGAYLDLQGETR
jgi:adenylate cyclase class IV